MAKQVTEANFEETISGSDITVIDFWAEWCGPCQKYGPIFSEVSDEMEGRANFVKVNVSDNQNLADRYSVKSIPCTVFVDSEGTEKSRFLGSVSKEKLISEVENILE